MTLAQITASMCLTERQKHNKKLEALRSTREIPQQLAVGLVVHQAFLSKKLVTLLSGFGLSIEYNRLLKVEALTEVTSLSMSSKEDLYFSLLTILISKRIPTMDNARFMEQLCRFTKRLSLEIRNRN